MIFSNLRPESPAQKSLSDSKVGEGDLSSDVAKRTKSFRRTRMELRRVRSLSVGKSGEDRFSCENSLNKRSEVGKGMTVVEKALLVQLPENDDDHCSQGGATTASHGMISVIGRRREMEDAVAVQLGFLNRGGRSYDFFGVYDGHGGQRVSYECGQMLHLLLAAVVEEETGDGVDWETALVSGFHRMDEEVNKRGAAVATMGSTAVVVVVGEKEVVVANCGDSRAVLSRGGVTVQLSDDHKPDRPDELERIEISGGKVINWNGERVLGVLATSRSIGDKYLKPYVISEPEVRVMNRTERDEFIILASDGLWDVVSNDLACQVVRRCLGGQIKMRSGESRTMEAATVLAEVAMGRGSRDNITVVVVALN